MRRRRKVGVDLDDVTFDAGPSLAQFHNSRYGTDYKPEDVKNWHLRHAWNCTEEEERRRVDEWFGTPEHREASPVEGALEAVTELSRHYDLHIITARSVEVDFLTREWVVRHFPGLFHGIHFSSHATLVGGPKAPICEALGVSFHIDDSLKHARQVAERGTTVLLFDKPWNQELVTGNIIRVYGWEEILDYALSLPAPAG